jgi:small conductance mechanosensitive channel
MKQIEEIMTLLKNWGVINIAAGLLILIVGFWIVSILTKIAARTMEKAKIDATLRPFLASLVSIALKVVVLLAAADQAGIAVTSFFAILASAGLAIGLALQGSLQNFAAGTMILVFKPYKVGDVIEVQGFVGLVKEIQIFNTVMMTPENKMVIIPNGAVTSGPITNISGPGLIRVDLTFNISYASDIDKTRQVIQSVADANDKILKTPPIDIFVSKHGATGLELVVRPFCHPNHYWDVYFYMNEELKKAFDKNGINGAVATYNVNLNK